MMRMYLPVVVGKGECFLAAMMLSPFLITLVWCMGWMIDLFDGPGVGYWAGFLMQDQLSFPGFPGFSWSGFWGSLFPSCLMVVVGSFFALIMNVLLSLVAELVDFFRV